MKYLLLFAMFVLSFGCSQKELSQEEIRKAVYGWSVSENAMHKCYASTGVDITLDHAIEASARYAGISKSSMVDLIDSIQNGDALSYEYSLYKHSQYLLVTQGYNCDSEVLWVLYQMR